MQNNWLINEFTANNRRLTRTGSLLLFLLMLAYSPLVLSGNYVDEALCEDCHRTQVNDWKRSDHQQSMQPANSHFVLAPFDGEWFRGANRELQFYKQQEAYVFSEKQPNGKTQQFTVSYVLGYDPLQQYVVKGNNGTYHMLDIAWDTVRQRWYPLSDEEFTPLSRLHWQGQFYRWNTSCADCHSTALDKNYSVQSNSYQTHYAQVNIGCQACHGPAGEHLDTINNSLNRKYSGFEQSWKMLEPQQTTEACAACHSSRQRISPSHNPFARFDDRFVLDLIQPGLYFPDGQIRDEVFVYGSFIQSKMHHQGVTCTNCHNPHSAQLHIEGNGLCTQCHNSAGRPDFPSLITKKL